MNDKSISDCRVNKIEPSPIKNKLDLLLNYNFFFWNVVQFSRWLFGLHLPYAIGPRMQRWQTIRALFFSLTKIRCCFFFFLFSFNFTLKAITFRPHIHCFYLVATINRFYIMNHSKLGALNCKRHFINFCQFSSSSEILLNETNTYLISGWFMEAAADFSHLILRPFQMGNVQAQRSTQKMTWAKQHTSINFNICFVYCEILVWTCSNENKNVENSQTTVLSLSKSTK